MINVFEISFCIKKLKTPKRNRKQWSIFCWYPVLTKSCDYIANIDCSRRKAAIWSYKMLSLQWILLSLSAVFCCLCQGNSSLCYVWFSPRLLKYDDEMIRCLKWTDSQSVTDHHHHMPMVMILMFILFWLANERNIIKISLNKQLFNHMSNKIILMLVIIIIYL